MCCALVTLIMIRVRFLEFVDLHFMSIVQKMGFPDGMVRSGREYIIGLTSNMLRKLEVSL